MTNNETEFEYQEPTVFDINGWRYDFASLPLWQERASIPWCTYKIFEDAEHDTACLLYGVVEERMLAYFGFCAVFRNKSDPVCDAAFTGIKVRQQNPAFSKDGRFLLLSAVYRGKGVILVLDLKNRKYALAELPDLTPVREITEEDADIFSYRFYETAMEKKLIRSFFKKKIRISKLSFDSWDAIKSPESKV